MAQTSSFSLVDLLCVIEFRCDSGSFTSEFRCQNFKTTRGVHRCAERQRQYPYRNLKTQAGQLNYFEPFGTLSFFCGYAECETATATVTATKKKTAAKLSPFRPPPQHTRQCSSGNGKIKYPHVLRSVR